VYTFNFSCTTLLWHIAPSESLQYTFCFRTCHSNHQSVFSRRVHYNVLIKELETSRMSMFVGDMQCRKVPLAQLTCRVKKKHDCRPECWVACWGAGCDFPMKILLGWGTSSEMRLPIAPRQYLVDPATDKVVVIAAPALPSRHRFTSTL
jgi:hypothetical protein